MCYVKDKKKFNFIRCDEREEKYIHEGFQSFARKQSFCIRPGPPYSSEVNGVAQRYNHILLMNKSRYLLMIQKFQRLLV